MLEKLFKLKENGTTIWTEVIAGATIAGAACGTSTVTAYIESVSGVKVGGRTGLTAVVVAIFFMMAIFFYPLVQMISGGVQDAGGALLYPVTAPALIIVGSMMIWGVKHIPWDDYAEAIPAFITIMAIPLTFSIADGIAMGFISYPVLKVASGRAKEVSLLVYALAVVFVLRYMFL